jgi:hypothetical protein
MKHFYDSQNIYKVNIFEYMIHELSIKPIFREYMKHKKTAKLIFREYMIHKKSAKLIFCVYNNKIKDIKNF